MRARGKSREREHVRRKRKPGQRTHLQVGAALDEAHDVALPHARASRKVQDAQPLPARSRRRFQACVAHVDVRVSARAARAILRKWCARALLVKPPHQTRDAPARAQGRDGIRQHAAVAVAPDLHVERRRNARVQDRALRGASAHG